VRIGGSFLFKKPDVSILDIMDNLGTSFEALIRADSQDPTLPAARATFISSLAKGFRGPLFGSRKAILVAAAVRCGPALAERVTREALHAVAEVSATQPGSLARPIAALLLQAAREAHSEPDGGCGHGGFTDPLIGEQLADFLPQHLGSLDPRVVIDRMFELNSFILRAKSPQSTSMPFSDTLKTEMSGFHYHSSYP